MPLNKEFDGKTLICKFSGDMNTGQTLMIEQEFNDCITQNEINSIIFDLQEVSYIASYFLRICTIAAKFVKPENFKLKNVSQDVYKIFSMGGFSDKFEIETI